MVDVGSALIVMGNHEFNAISFATPNPEVPGEFMRRHTAKNRKQHKDSPIRSQRTRTSTDSGSTGSRLFPLARSRRYPGRPRMLEHRGDCRSEPVGATGTPMSTDFVVRANQKGALSTRLSKCCSKDQSSTSPNTDSPALRTRTARPPSRPYPLVECGGRNPS